MCIVSKESLLSRKKHMNLTKWERAAFEGALCDQHSCSTLMEYAHFIWDERSRFAPLYSIPQSFAGARNLSMFMERLCSTVKWKSSQCFRTPKILKCPPRTHTEAINTKHKLRENTGPTSQNIWGSTVSYSIEKFLSHASAVGKLETSACSWTGPEDNL